MHVLFCLFNLMSKTSKIHCTDFNALNGTHVEDVEDVLKYMYSLCMYRIVQTEP